MKVYFTADNAEQLTQYNGGKPCPLEDTECQKPVFQFDDNTELTIEFKAPDLSKSTLNALGDKVIGKAVKVEFKACYANQWTKDRKWRKAKDIISVSTVGV